MRSAAEAPKLILHGVVSPFAAANWLGCACWVVRDREGGIHVEIDVGGRSVRARFRLPARASVLEAETPAKPSGCVMTAQPGANPLSGDLKSSPSGSPTPHGAGAPRGISDEISDFSFRVLGPDSMIPPDHRYRLERPNGSTAVLLETAESRLETLVIDFGPQDVELKALLGPLLGIRKMSRVGIGAAIQRAVAQMDPGHLFVNVGVWNGFTLLCGMAGNDDKMCIGVDNFSEFGGPRQVFLSEFFARRARSHRFFESDYRDFFARGVDSPLGVYLYDGEHSYENQYEGLMTADPFFVEGSVVIVDDANLERARDATYRFAVDSRLDWNVVLDMRTTGNCHVTLWNGLMILEAASHPMPSVTWPLTASIASELALAGAWTPDSYALTVINMTRRPVTPEYTAGPVEVVDVSSSKELTAAIDASTGAFLFFVQDDNPVQWAAIARSASAASYGFPLDPLG